MKRSLLRPSVSFAAVVLMLSAPLTMNAQGTRAPIGPELPPDFVKAPEKGDRGEASSREALQSRQLSGREAFDNSADATVTPGTVLGANVRPGVSVEPALNFETTFVDLGEIDEGQSVTARFPFVNTSANTVTITTTQTSCGCTVATLDKKVFAPGEGDVVEIEFNSTGRPGVNDRLIRVVTDEVGVSNYAVRLRTVVRQDVWLSQRVAAFGDVSAGQERTMTINVLSVANEPLEIVQVANPRNQVEVTLNEAQPYTAPGKEGVMIPVTLTLPAETIPGRINGNIVLTTNLPDKYKTLSIIYSGNVLGAVSATPERLYFGVVPPGTRQITTGSVSVASGTETFTLESVEVLPQKIANADRLVTPVEALPEISVTIGQPPEGSTIQTLTAIANVGDYVGHIQGNLLLTGKIGEKEEKIHLPFRLYVQDQTAAATGQQPAAAAAGPGMFPSERANARPATARSAVPTKVPGS